MIAFIQVSHLCGHLSVICSMVLLKFIFVLEALRPNIRGVVEAALASIELMAASF